MVEFGKQLRESIKGSRWQAEYLDYKRLKKLLKPPQEPVIRSSPDLLLGQQEFLEREEEEREVALARQERLTISRFRHVLDQEIEKVVLFLLQEQGRIATELSQLGLQRQACVTQVSTVLEEFQERQELEQLKRSLRGGEEQITTQTSTMTSSEESSSGEAYRRQVALLELIQTNHAGYTQIGQSILQFLNFVELNVTAVRKILKKHDKTFPQYKLGPSYLSNFTSQVDSHLDQLYHYGGLSALTVTLKRAFDELYLMEASIVWMEQQSQQRQQERAAAIQDDHPKSPTSQKGNGSHRRVRSLPLLHDSLVLEDEGHDTRQTPRGRNYPLSLDPQATGFLGILWNHHHGPPSPSSSPRNDLVVGTSIITSPNEPLIDQIHRAKSRLIQNTNYVQVIAAQSGMFFEEEALDGDDDDDPTVAAAEELLTKGQEFSSFLNLCSTFLYMTNYYIVAPTCGNYASKLGSTEAMAGIIIGMTPNAALIATVLYGWWSNYSYKSALIFAAGSSMLGNICYALALQQDSLTLVMIGRFFNGFGSARSINRRFIADTFSRRDRTAASAAFVTAGALGMAAGPAIAAIVAFFGLDDDTATSLLWTTETAPGWIMLGMWSIFFVSAILFFEEPDRSHLFGPSTPTNATIEVSTTGGETKPLLDNKPANSVISNESTIKSSFYSSNGDSITSSSQKTSKAKPAVWLTLWIYFVLKLVLEALSSSCATLTAFYFGWDSQITGAFLAFLGLLMFPANMVVARLSHRYEDRELIHVTLMVMLVSLLGIIAYRPMHYSVYQYFIFGVCIFTSTNILEGPNMSLLSKTIPKSWAKGIFNSGFLATEAGTLARSVGDVMISAAAALVGTSNLLNATFLPPLVLVLGTLLLVRNYFEYMIEEDEDDDSRSRTSTDKQSSFQDD